MEPLDCGDNSCWFAFDKKGQRTNGGCRCLGKHNGVPSQLRHRILVTWQKLQGQLRQSMAETVHYQKQLLDGVDKEKALKDIVNVLGPEPLKSSHGCDGCAAEMAEALSIARKALGLDGPDEVEVIQNG